MQIALFGWILGLIGGLYLPKLSIVFFLCFLLGILLLKNVKKKYSMLRIVQRHISYQKIIVMAISFILAFLLIQEKERDYSQRYAEVMGEAEVIGTIVSMPKEKEYRTDYTMQVESINGQILQKNTKILLQLKKGKQAQKNLVYGNKIKVKVELKMPTEARNTGGFDYSFYLKTKQIYAIAIGKEDDVTLLKNENSNLWQKAVTAVKQSIIEQVKKVLPQEEADLFIGILIGERQGIQEEIEKNFKNSSLTHLLAVSGSHVAYILMGVTFAVTQLKGDKKIGKIGTILFLFFFMELTDRTASVVRACIMAMYAIVANLCHKKIDWLGSICFSLWWILLENPYSLWDTSLILSYGGTIGILLFIPLFQKKQNPNEGKNHKLLEKCKNYLKESFIITISANLILLPIMAYLFYTLSFTFWIGNLLATPLMEGIIFIGIAFLASAYLCMPLAIIIAVSLKCLLQLLLLVAKVCANLPFSNISVIRPPVVGILFYYIFLFLWIGYGRLSQRRKAQIKEMYRKKRKTVLISFLLMVVLLTFLYKVPGELEIFFIDVGQGDSMLVITPQKKTLLVDGGGSKSTSFDVGEQTLLPYLLNKGIKTIDYMMPSHFDEDHVQGLFTILEKLTVKKVIVAEQKVDSENYQKFMKFVEEKNIQTIWVKQGDKILLEKGVNLDILWPKTEWIAENPLNNNAIVANLHYGKFSLLFTGDIEEIAEKEILQCYQNTELCKATVLKVAHHGSKSSSIQSFLTMVKPKIALIGVGETNTFGHPNEGVLERLEKIGAKIYRTDENGEISLKVNKEGKIKINTKIGK